MIIGSSAIKHYFPGFNRVPKDIDIVIHSGIKGKPKQINGVKVEYLNNPVLIDWVYNTHCVLPNNNCFDNLYIPEYCPLSELYTLKCSHVLWDLDNGSWSKHVFDINWLKEQGCIFIPELFYELVEYWTKIYGKRKTSDLSLSAEMFFNNSIKFPIEHDRIHELLITHPYFEGQKEPTYKKILKDGCEVDICEIKFNNLTENEKFRAVFEEIAVMSSEFRFPKEWSYKKKYDVMLKQFILHHAKLFQAIWIIQNHKLLLCNIPFNFEKFIHSFIK